MKTGRKILWAGLMLLMTACGGGSDDPGAGGGAGSGFTAVVEGKPWAAEPIGVTALGGGVPGGIVITGSQIAGDRVTSVSISLGWITGPGTYPLGVGPEVFGGSGSVGESMVGSGGSSDTWATALDGLGGSITITTLGGGRIVGTFAYTTEASKKNTVGGTRTVTDGKIDLPLQGTVPAVPENMGARLSATLNGKPYNAWGINGLLMDFMGGPGVNISSHSSVNTLSLMLQGVTAPGSYPLSNMQPLRTLIVGKNGGDAAHCCWGLNGGPDEGTITVTSLTATRVKGTFSGTLQPQPGKPATAPLVITDGVFDLGIR